MRLAEYSWVFDDWQPLGVTLVGAGWSPCIYLGLPYVEFHAWTDRGAVSVRCDPCSLDQDRTAYAAMVRADLELALAKHERLQPPKFNAPTRLSRHLRESKPGMAQTGGNLTLYFHDNAKALRASLLTYEVVGGETIEQSPP